MALRPGPGARLWALSALAGATGRALAARARGRPLVAEWPLLAEAAVRAVRRFLDGLPERDPAVSRRRFVALATALPVSSGGVRCREQRLRGVRALRYIPPAPAARTLLYFHGGGYVLGAPEGAHELALRLTRATGAEVWVPDYRLAPEHPFPAALEDAVAAYRALLDRGLAPADLVVAGDSAGGGLAAAVLMALREAGEPLPGGAVLISPWVELDDAVDASGVAGTVDSLTTGALDQFRTLYCGAGAARDPRASPAYGDPAGLPRLLVQVGELEILRAQGERFAERCRAAGVPVELQVAPRMMHVWHYFAAVLPEGRAGIVKVAEFLRESGVARDT